MTGRSASEINRRRKNYIPFHPSNIYIYTPFNILWLCDEGTEQTTSDDTILYYREVYKYA